MLYIVLNFALVDLLILIRKPTESNDERFVSDQADVLQPHDGGDRGVCLRSELCRRSQPRQPGAQGSAPDLQLLHLRLVARDLVPYVIQSFETDRMRRIHTRLTTRLNTNSAF